MSTLVLVLLLQTAGASPTAQMGVSVAPDTVLVGDPFTVTVRVRAPLGMRIEFPVGPDTTGGSAAPIQLMAPRTDRASPADPREFTVAYTLTAWDVGTLPVGIPAVRLVAGNRTGFLDLSKVTVHVRSVLPADSAKHVPKAARAVIPVPGRNWWPLILLAIAIAVAELIWFVWRYFRRRRNAPVDPYDAAIAEFTRIQALDLPASGEPERHVVLMTDVMRRYVGARIPEARLSHTTSELERALHAAELREERLVPILEEADLVKFARGTTPPARARDVGAEARALVETIEARVKKAAQKVAA